MKHACHLVVLFLPVPPKRCSLNILLQLADLTGELMRLAIGRISDGELEFAEKICRFVRDIYRELTLVAPNMDDSSDMKTKMDTMLQSVMKIENGNVSAFKILFVRLMFPSIILFKFDALKSYWRHE